MLRGDVCGPVRKERPRSGYLGAPARLDCVQATLEAGEIVPTGVLFVFVSWESHESFHCPWSEVDKQGPARPSSKTVAVTVTVTVTLVVVVGYLGSVEGQPDAS